MATRTGLLYRLVGYLQTRLDGWRPLPPFDARWDRARKGRWGERAAARYLWKHGHRLLARNVRYPSGELDLVSDEKGTLVFTEVKLRLDPESNPPALAVDEEKLRRIRRAGRRYLRRVRSPFPPVRVDVVSVVPDPCSRHPRIEHLRAVVWLHRNPADSPESPPRPAAGEKKSLGIRR